MAKQKPKFKANIVATVWFEVDVAGETYEDALLNAKNLIDSKNSSTFSVLKKASGVHDQQLTLQCISDDSAFEKGLY